MKVQISINGKILYTISGIDKIESENVIPFRSILRVDNNIVATIPKGHLTIVIPENQKKETKGAWHDIRSEKKVDNYRYVLTGGLGIMTGYTSDEELLKRIKSEYSCTITRIVMEG